MKKFFNRIGALIYVPFIITALFFPGCLGVGIAIIFYGIGIVSLIDLLQNEFFSTFWLFILFFFYIWGLEKHRDKMQKDIEDLQKKIETLANRTVDIE